MIMISRVYLSSLVFCISTAFVCTKCCIYTSMILFVILSNVGMTPEYCVGQIENTANQYHAWIRIGSDNVEPSTLNLYHSNRIDYDNPEYVFNNTKDFKNSVDMWSLFK